MVRWRDANKVRYPALGLLVHIPNEGKRSPRAGLKLKLAGLTKAAPDFVLLSEIRVLNPDWQGGVLMCEMKSQIGKQSPEQVEFENLAKSQGNTYVVCRTAFEFVEVIKKALSLFPEQDCGY